MILFSNAVQVGYSHVVVDARDAPRKAFLAVGFKERTKLCALYRGRVYNGIGFIRIPCEHLVGCVAQAIACFLAMGACAVRKVGV